MYIWHNPLTPSMSLPTDILVKAVRLRVVGVTSSSPTRKVGRGAAAAAATAARHDIGQVLLHDHPSYCPANSFSWNGPRSHRAFALLRDAAINIVYSAARSRSVTTIMISCVVVTTITQNALWFIAIDAMDAPSLCCDVWCSISIYRWRQRLLEEIAEGNRSDVSMG